MREIDKATARKALESYIKGLTTDFEQETGMRIETIELQTCIDSSTNRRVITNVSVKTDVEVLGAVL